MTLEVSDTQLFDMKSNNLVGSTGKSLSDTLLFVEHGENKLCTKIVLNVRIISIMGTLGPLRKLEDFFDVISPREEISYFFLFL